MNQSTNALIAHNSPRAVEGYAASLFIPATARAQAAAVVVNAGASELEKVSWALGQLVLLAEVLQGATESNSEALARHALNQLQQVCPVLESSLDDISCRPQQ